MQGTRDRVLELIVERRSARVEEIAEAIGITPAAVRRHLDHLRADGLVDVRAVKQATGRPYHAYTPTDLAAGVMPPAYADLLERMLKGVERDESIDQAVVSEVASSLAERHRADLPASTDQATRIQIVTESLREEGILDRWYRGEDGFHLVNDTCPYLRAAEMSHLPCESDRKAIELLVGSPVEQVERIVDGKTCCEYVVSVEPA